jgi:predicted Zn-dependent protease
MYFKNAITVVSFILLSAGPLVAQVDFNNYSTLLAKGKIPEDFTKLTYDKLKDDLKTGREELRRGQEKVFFEGTNYAIDEILHSGLVVYGDEISTYISEIVDKLLKNDGQLRAKLRFYTIKSNSSNAFSTDQGIVFVTTGLIAQLTSEAQLAYVLAHEISHYTEKHVVATFDWKAKNSRQDSRIEKLSQYSKEKEFDADKIGIRLYNEAGYSEDEIFSTFDVLMYSYLPFDEIAFPQTHFNTNKIYIPKSLFPTKKYEITAVEDYDDENSSHPNIKKRKEAAEKEVGEFSTWGKNTEFLGATRFVNVRNIARFESVRTDILDANYGDAMYSIFLLEKDFPNSIYLKRMKAQIWMNLMLYKSENISNKAVDKTAELEGESATLHFFLKKLSKEALVTMSLRQIYDIHKAYPQDEEINAIFQKFVKDLNEYSKFKSEMYSKKTFSEAANDFMAMKNDSLKGAVKDTTIKSNSKYDRIKNKKNADIAENFDSTKFYLYGIADIISDQEFIDLNGKFKKISEEKEQEKIAYEALSKKEKKAFDKKEAQNVNRLGIKEFIVVEPMVYSYNKGKVDNVKSEKLEADFSEAIEDAANDAGVTTYNIDSRSLTTKGTQGFNERSMLTALLNQIAQEDEVNIFPVDYQYLNLIKSNYGTSKVMFSLVEHEYSPNISFSGVFSSLLIYPVLLLYVPIGILTGHESELSVLILDLEDGSIENGVNYYFKDSPKKLQLGAHMFDIFKKLSTEPKK